MGGSSRYLTVLVGSSSRDLPLTGLVAVPDRERPVGPSRVARRREGAFLIKKAGAEAASTS